MVRLAPIDVDEALLKRLVSRDVAALEELYDRYGQSLHAFASRLAGDAAVGEEILQDTLVAAWQGAARFERRSSLRTWLFGIARRQAHNRTRSLRLSTVSLDEAGDRAGTTDLPEDVAIASAGDPVLRRCIDGLSPIHREVLHLTFVESMPYRDIAELLAISLGTVKSRLSNAKRALAIALDKEGS